MDDNTTKVWLEAIAAVTLIAGQVAAAVFAYLAKRQGGRNEAKIDRVEDKVNGHLKAIADRAFNHGVQAGVAMQRSAAKGEAVDVPPAPGVAAPAELLADANRQAPTPAPGGA